MNQHETAEARALIAYLLDAGCALSVHDGEETTLKGSTDAAAIFAALGTTEADMLIAWHVESARTSQFLLVYGNGPGELIADHSDAPEADAAWRYVQRVAVPVAYRC